MRAQRPRRGRCGAGNWRGADTTFPAGVGVRTAQRHCDVVALVRQGIKPAAAGNVTAKLTFRSAAWTAAIVKKLRLIAEGKIDTEPLITHTYPLRRIAEGVTSCLEKKRDGVRCGGGG